MQTGLPKSQADILEQALVSEAKAMRELFTLLDDGLAGVAEGAQESMLEEDVPEGELEILKVWGVKWRRAFRRKLAVEEVVVSEASRLFPEPGEEVEETAMAVDEPESGANGAANGTDDGANGGDPVESAADSTMAATNANGEDDLAADIA